MQCEGIEVGVDVRITRRVYAVIKSLATFKLSLILVPLAADLYPRIPPLAVSSQAILVGGG